MPGSDALVLNVDGGAQLLAAQLLLLPHTERGSGLPVSPVRAIKLLLSV